MNGVIYVGMSGTLESLSGRKADHQRSEKKASGVMYYAHTRNTRKTENIFIKHFKDKGQAQLNKQEKSGAGDEPGFVYIIVGTSPLLFSSVPAKSSSEGPLKTDGTPDNHFSANLGCASTPAKANSVGPLKANGTPDMRYSANRGCTSKPAQTNFAGPLKANGTPDMRYSVNRGGA